MTKFLLFASLFYLIGCATTKEVSKEETASTEPQSVYVFDDVSDSETESTESTEASSVAVTEVAQAETKPAAEVVEPEETNQSFQFFIVQLGAFSTEEKAETFVQNNKTKTNYEMNIHFSDKVKLHVVQLTPFRTREKADEVRDELRKIKDFEGAFIVPNNN